MVSRQVPRLVRPFTLVAITANRRGLELTRVAATPSDVGVDSRCRVKAWLLTFRKGREEAATLVREESLGAALGVTRATDFQYQPPGFQLGSSATLIRRRHTEVTSRANCSQSVPSLAIASSVTPCTPA